MVELAIPEDPVELDRVLEELPKAGRFLLWPREGKPYLARTNVLRKRLKRLFGDLRGTIERIEYQFTGSRLAAQFLVLSWREIPRGGIIATTSAPSAALREAHSIGSVSAYADDTNIGRARRCTSVRFAIDDGGAVRIGVFGLVSTAPVSGVSGAASRYPGCIYGEMGRCLRPCQQAVGMEEYRGETDRGGGISEDRWQKPLGSPRARGSGRVRRWILKARR